MAAAGVGDEAGGAVLLTGVGKRYDIVSAFAQHTTVIAADPNPLAPAQYAAQVRHAVPRIDSDEYVPALQSLCSEYGVGAVVPLTDLDIEVLAIARAGGLLPAFVPDPEIAGRRTTSTTRTCCSRDWGSLAADRTPRFRGRQLPGHGETATRIRGPFDPSRRRRRGS